jgi:hypothetical protein
MASSSPPPKDNNERTPLLATRGAARTAQAYSIRNRNTSDEEDDQPLPLTQIFLLCYARLVEPVAFFAIFPFINKMIYETGELDEADVGFCSGWIVCLPFHF